MRCLFMARKSQHFPSLCVTYMSSTARPLSRAESLHIFFRKVINIISWWMRWILLEMQVWAGTAICAHQATLIYNDTLGNGVSRFICKANRLLEQTNVVHQSDMEGANCAEVARSNMRVHNWRTRSVCVKNHLHITFTVSLRWWIIISWKTYSVRGRDSLCLFSFCFTFSFVGPPTPLCRTLCLVPLSELTLGNLKL